MTTSAAPGGRPAPVLFVHSGLNWITGSERCMLDLVAHVDRRRYAPIVWCDAPAVADAAAALGVPAVLAPSWGTHTGLLPGRDQVAAARAMIARHGVRLVHANDTAPLKALLPAALGARIPVLAHLHLRLTSDERRWSLLHQVSFAVGVSEASVRGLRDDGFPTERMAVVYNGVDAARLARGDARALRAELGARPTDVVFAVVGSLILRKGIDVVIEAARLLAARRDDWWLLVCGDGPEEARLRAQAEQAGVGARVRFLGRRPDVGAVVRDAVDVLVSGAREESFGLNLAEAGLFGVPAVATDIEAHAEVVRDGREAVLVPRDDPSAFAAALDALAAEPERRRALGAAARERVEALFLVDRYVREFEGVYQRLLAAPPRAYGVPGALVWPPAYTAWATGAARRQLARAIARWR